VGWRSLIGVFSFRAGSSLLIVVSSVQALQNQIQAFPELFQMMAACALTVTEELQHCLCGSRKRSQSWSSPGLPTKAEHAVIWYSAQEE